MSKKVMIIDDSALSRRIMHKILSTIEGVDIIEVSDPLMAIETCVNQMPDLVLLDLNMEGLTGMELLVRLHELNPSLRVIIASADIQKATIQEAMNHGAIDYITKPFNDADIIEKVLITLK